LVRLRVRAGRVRGDLLSVGCQKLRLHRFGCGSGDIVLHCKNVVDVAIIRLRPELKSVVSLNELCRDAKMLAVPSQAPLENTRHAELPAYRTQILVLPLELKCRRPSHHLYPGYSGKIVNQLFRESV